jgi:hypothetical protein
MNGFESAGDRSGEGSSLQSLALEDLLAPNGILGRSQVLITFTIKSRLRSSHFEALCHDLFYPN